MSSILCNTVHFQTVESSTPMFNTHTLYGFQVATTPAKLWIAIMMTPNRENCTLRVIHKNTLAQADKRV